MKTKRVLSILLVLAMALSLFSVTAFAEEQTGFDNFKKVSTLDEGKFEDVNSTDWFWENTKTVYELGLMVGRSETEFAPDENMTVAEAMTIAARLNAIYKTGKAEFTKTEPWYKAYTDYCKANAISDIANYDPNAFITRGQFADIFANVLPKEALAIINEIKDGAIPDVKEGDAFANAVYALYRAGILVGNDDKGTFASNTDIKRSEVSAIAGRMAVPAQRQKITLKVEGAEYTVSFDLGYENKALNPVKVKDGEKVTAPTNPTRSGYNFAGWYTEKTGGTKFDFNKTITADTALFAHWNIRSGGGGSRRTETKTMAEILASNPDIPKSENDTPPANAWLNENDSKCKAYIGVKNSEERFYLVKEDTGAYTYLKMSREFTKVGNDYVYTDDTGTFTFIMKDGKFTSVKFEANAPDTTSLSGTYAPAVSVTGVTLDKSEVTIEVGDEDVKLSATVLPDNATDKSVNWSSSNNDVATVDNAGNVHAVAAGEATITVTTVDGSKTATCDVKVTAPATTIETVADVLATNPDFPKAEANAWTNKNGKKCYLNGEYLVVAGTPYPIGSLDIEDSGENDYESRTENGLELTFNMINGVLTSIDVFGIEDNKNGIYAPPGTIFKAVYNTKDDANTLTFYYDAVDHSGEGITVYADLPTAATKQGDWGYNGNRTGIKSVIIDESVKIYDGLTSTSYMFQGMKNANSISGAEYLDVSNVTNMSLMFQNFGGGDANSHTTLNSVPDVSNWNTSNVTNMSSMFQKYGHESQNFNAVPDVSKWNTGNVTNMANMFMEYSHKSTKLDTVPDVSSWNTGKVTSMADMFSAYGYSSPALTKVPDVSGWSTAKLTNLGNMFRDYGGLSTTGGNITVESNVEFTLDLSGWDLTELGKDKGGSLFNLKPKTFNVKIPAKTGEKANETGKWYYGDGTDYIVPASGKSFTLAAAPAPVPVFSVSATKKVTFSPGNLQATINDGGTPTAWKFATHQYDCIGENGANKTIGIAGGDIDLFGWSTASTSYGISTSTNNSDYAGDFVDWGKAISGGNSWRSLTCDEWTYLVNTRTNASNLYKCDVTVCGNKCLIIAPDNWDISTIPLQSSYNEASWATAEADGLVCLPYAGYLNASTVNDLGAFGYYWTADAANEIKANYTIFSNTSIVTNKPRSRYVGQSVRLVKDAE